jgi:hypothetical protein
MKEPLADEDLRPTHTPFAVDPDRQADSMRQLRDLENRGRLAEQERNGLMYALALSNSLSRPDMARAIGVSRSRVDQLLREHHDLLEARRAAEAAERVARRSSLD